MKIAVIAANGRSGQAFVELALQAGHSINAGVRGNSTHLKPHPNLVIMQCDATNESLLSELIRGQDAVTSFIGHVKKSAPDVQTIAITKIIKVMNELGVRRLISLTGTGVRFPNDKITLIDRFLNLGISLVDPARVRDGKSHVDAIKLSGLDWTVLRVLKLQNTAAKPFRLTPNGPTKPYVSRLEVAQATLQVLEQSSFIQQAPIISNI